jgi:beta-lactam-binding protein with PASTA domain/tRNA A-37 threonylcarbamoyl transferase component Bud32
VSETLTDPLLGRVVDGRYEIKELVATGGMATVYVAFDRRLEREVALKAMHQPLADDATSREFVARFRREAKSSARLTHPGIVHVYDQGVDGELSYLTMEYVRGENLRARIAHEGTLPVGEALALTDAILDALAAAHRLGLVHRDIKPENVLIDHDGRARITDFGLARAVNESAPQSDTMVMGSPGYLAPELLSLGEATPATDVYAAGVMLFEMVTGRHPFTGESAIDIAVRHVHEDIPAPSSFAPWLPTEFDDLVATLSQRSPAERPADAASALVLVRSTRALMDDPTLDKRADPPSGTFAITADPDATTVLEAAPTGATVALPIGIGRPFAPVGDAVDLLADEDPEALQPEPAQRRAWWWVAAIVTVTIALVGTALWWYNAIGPGAFTTVPPVEGFTEEEASDALTAVGFTVTIEEQNHDDIPDGWAIDTDPSAQSRVEKGSEVTLFVSMGPKMTEVPVVAGSTEEEAIAALTELDFSIGEIERVYRDTVPKGEVISTDPAAGEVVRHDSVISLTVSDGPAPIEVPNVVGLTLEDAQKLLAEDLLEVTVEHGRTEEVPEGSIFKQDPGAGAEGKRTDPITIWVSDGPPLVEVPDLRGMQFNEARKLLTELGFEVDGKDEIWNFSKVVFAQTPGPLEMAEKGSTVVVSY